ncbi:hypothetical protein AKJ16_DCAP25526 [Drosera capensis]
MPVNEMDNGKVVLHSNVTRIYQAMRYRTLAFKSHTFIFSSHPKHHIHKHIALASSSSSSSSSSAPSLSLTSSSSSSSSSYKVRFDSLEGCKLGIARYPDFDYNARGGGGQGEGKVVNEQQVEGEGEFDVEGLYIPPLSYATTKFLGLPLPPFLKIEIAPEVFQGRIGKLSGKVNLEFKAKFVFSIGTLYKAPPLLVATILTSEESTGEMRSGRGQRLDNAGLCRLVGAASVEPINDLFMNTFLSLPTECLHERNDFSGSICLTKT